MSSSTSLPVANSVLSTCANGTVVATRYGLNYTVYCDRNLPGNDLDSIPDAADSLDECIEICTVKWPLCAGATWLPSAKKCYRKNKDIAETILNPEIGTVSFLAFKTQITQDPRDTACPYGNLATHNTTSGRQYKILCGAYYANAAPNLLRTHTTSMDECLELCDKHHPLCTRISFIADMTGSGWLNCELKTESRAKPSWFTRTMGHSAEALAVKLSQSKCDDDILAATNGKGFRTSCSDHRDLNSTAVRPLRTFHERTLQACRQRCLDSNVSCNALSFDAGLRSGYENCYLFDNLPPPLNRSRDHTFAYSDSLAAKYVEPPPEPSLVRNRAWIAAAVVGPIVLGIGLVWIWKQRAAKAKKKAT
ncbi:hypothetical protein C7974DRAFT_385082 [Boeremia exigua]|uniref:uncharacterized protein n=1 Tax=Boeremia exigua TaxID=749465 RepID=UPI001E8D4A7D|nr:uncharacterized protein C7974DRAFT_385082 [Boeremia exigua]KAH6642233.1 hypothetical protein C7974DRAFT_385082 [Boeremia exigua]